MIPPSACCSRWSRTGRWPRRPSWASGDVLIAGLPATSDDACYRTMDCLLGIRDELEKKAFDNLADLLNLEVDLLFFDYPANRVRGLALAA